jgi:hypothetical protein
MTRSSGTTEIIFTVSAREGGRNLPSHRAADARQGEEVNTMDNLKVTLCPLGCGACPDVEIVGDEVRIGEAGNVAVLNKDE